MNVIFKQFIIFVSNLGDLMELAFRGPFRAVQKKRRLRKQHWTTQLLWLPVVLFTGLLSLGYRAFASPQKIYRRLSRNRRRDLLYAVPAILAMLVAGYVLFVITARNSAIEAQYRAKANSAMADREFEKAAVYLNRIMQNNESPSQADRLALALALSETDQQDRATSILNELAPDDRIGFDRAHTLKALSLANAMQKSPESKNLELLRWHLEHAEKKQNPELSQVWAMYYIEVQQPEEAIPYLVQASTLNPALLISAADIYRRTNQPGAADRVLQDAEKVYDKALSRKPTDIETRVQLARILTRLNRVEEAEQLLLNGRKIQKSPQLTKAICEFYVLRHDLAVRDRQPMSAQLRALRNAMEYDIHFVPIYERLILQYRRPGQHDNSIAVKEILEEAIALGDSTSLAHFAIGNLYWLSGQMDQAEFHIKQAYLLDDRMAVVGNNLAWLLAHKPEPDLDQALRLAVSVLEKAPDDPRFRDTLATVLLKQGKYREALVEFERTLSEIEDKKSVHQKIALVYEQLENDHLATLHRNLAKNLGP